MTLNRLELQHGRGPQRMLGTGRVALPVDRDHIPPNSPGYGVGMLDIHSL